MIAKEGGVYGFQVNECVWLRKMTAYDFQVKWMCLAAKDGCMWFSSQMDVFGCKRGLYVVFKSVNVFG